MKIISFNSYKGGACRTTTCYNTLPFLAKELGATSAQPILVFDVDLDSMGMTNLLDKQGKFNHAKYSANNLFKKDLFGICEHIKNNEFDDEEDLENYYALFNKAGKELGLEDDGAVLFCGVDSAMSNFSDDTFKSVYDEINSPLGNLIRALNGLEDDQKPKAIVFDCAAGVQMSTIMVLEKVNTMVMCMRPTFQFRTGTSHYIINRIPQKLRHQQLSNPRRLVLVPTAVAACGANSTREILMLRNESYRGIQNIRELADTYSAEDLGYRFIDDMIDDLDTMGIPEVERFKWKEEGVLYKIQDCTPEEEILKSRYQKLAQVIIK